MKTFVLKVSIILVFFCQFLSAQNDYYWVGGNGSWSDLNHWRIGSSAGATATIIPSRYDNVFFTNNSGFSNNENNRIYSSTNTLVCKNFTIEDGFSGMFTFNGSANYSAITMTIYGDVQWRQNVFIADKSTINLVNDNVGISNLIDIPTDVFWKNSYNNDNGTYQYFYNLNLTGNGSWKLKNNLGGNHYDVAVKITDSAKLDLASYGLTAKYFTYDSSTISDFGTSELRVSTAQINDKVNLSQSIINLSVFFYTLNYPGQLIINGNQTIKKVATNILKNSIKTNSFELVIDQLEANKAIDFYGKIAVNNMILNSSLYRINNEVSSNYLKINQSLSVNKSCDGTPEFLAYGKNDLNLNKGNIVAPASLALNFPNYRMTGIAVTGGTAMYAAVDGGNNTGNITYGNIVNPQVYYWIGGGGSWVDKTHWAVSSGGASVSCMPTMFDDVIFDNNSGFLPNQAVSAQNTDYVEFRNMTWNNAPNKPDLIISGNIYGNLYLQKEMSTNSTSYSTLKFKKTITSAAPVTRNIKTEGIPINLAIFLSGNDNFNVLPASNASDLDLYTTDFFLDQGNLIAENRKLRSINTFSLSGNSAQINGATIDANRVFVQTASPINAPDATVILGNLSSLTKTEVNYFTDNSTHYIGNVTVNASSMSANFSPFINFKTLTVNDARIINFNSGGYTSAISKLKNFINKKSSISIIGGKLDITDTFVFNRTGCDAQLNFTGNLYTTPNLILGNNINGNALVQLNKLNITNLAVTGGVPNPIIASNSQNSGGNSGISFSTPTSKTFYWVGGQGNWDDEAHWSLVTGSANISDKCGIPTLYDNAIFDVNSGFTTATNNKNVIITRAIYINDLIWENAPGNPVFSTQSGTDFWINGHLKFQDNLSFSTGINLNFINQEKAAGTIKTVDPRGVIVEGVIFSGNAQWKVVRGTMPTDINANRNITQNGTGNVLDLGGAIVKSGISVILSGQQVLLDNTQLTTRILNVSTTQPIVDNNSRFFLTGFSSASFNNLNHYFHKIDIETTSQYAGNTFDFPGGLINQLTLLPSASNSYNVSSNVPTIVFQRLNSVNNFNLRGKNIVSLNSDVTILKSMNIGDDCLQKLRLFSNSTTARKLIIPTYNATDYKITNSHLKSISSSNSQNYTATGSVNEGGNSGIDFIGNPTASRTLYWIGGQGDFNDASHWSLTTGGAPLSVCFAPSPLDDVIFDANSGFTTTENKIVFSSVSSARNVTFNNAPNKPILDFGTDQYRFNYFDVYGDLVLQNDVKLSIVERSTIARNIRLQQSASINSNRIIDTKNVFLYLYINAQDQFELRSPFKGEINLTNIKGFKTNNFAMDLINFTWNQTLNNTPNLDLGSSIITGFNMTYGGVANYYTYAPSFTITSGSNPVDIIKSNSLINTKFFKVTVPNVGDFGNVTIQKDGILDTGSVAHNYNKVTFLGSSTSTSVSQLSSPGGYQFLYFNPGNYQIATGQTIAQNLFMTGTPCNRINVSRVNTSGKSTVNLEPTATYTMFYASIKDLDFNRPVNAYGNSQDLGNTTNLNIIPTNVQAAGFGGNKVLCATDFPKTYDAATLYGTDPNATYLWTKLNAPNAGVVSNTSIVSFTQTGNYRVSVTYSQDACSISEDFTISSVTPPVVSTVDTKISESQGNGNVPVKFKGSDATKTYIFTYAINGGQDLEITSGANAEAILLQPKLQEGIFIYTLKLVRYADTNACIIPLNVNTKITINPACTEPGVIRKYGDIVRGCTQNNGARKLSEDVAISVSEIIENGVTRLIPNVGIVVKEVDQVYPLKNINTTSESLVLPSNKTHVKGSIIYHNDHYYEGVDDGKWIRIDND